MATRSDGGTYHVYWFENSNWDRTTIHQESAGAANYVRVRDLDDNGRPDVMVTEIEGQISAWLQTGDSSVDWYIRRGMINCTGSNQWITSGDFDSDGVWDMAGLTSSSTGGKIQWCDYTTGGYPLSGSLTTSIFMVPFGTDLIDVLWGNMIWSAYEPDNTDIGFQVRASSDPLNMGPWTDTIWVNGEYLDPLLPIDGIFVQCIAHMMTADPDVTPILRWFCAEGCVPGGVEQGEDNSGNSISLALEVNPVNEAPCFCLTLPVAVEANLTVYDIIGRIAIFENLGYMNAGTVTYQTSLLLPGIYFARLHAGNETAELRFIVISE